MQSERQQVRNAFANCGVQRGDCLMLHADAIAAAQFPDGTIEQRMELLIAGILDLLSDSGTLVMPTFTYSATKREIFDLQSSASEVGMLTEYFRRRPDVLRSRHPIFSVAATGRLAKEFASSRIDDCFGPGTAFDLLYQHDAWLACLACPIERITFVHYVEQAVGVDYRYFKEFPFVVRDRQENVQGTVRYYVRDLNRRTGVSLWRLQRALFAEGALKSVELGRVRLLAVRSRHFYRLARQLIAVQRNALIEEGNPEGHGEFE